MLGSLEFGRSAGTTWALVAAGPVTVIPLLLFAGAAGRIPLSLIGLLQYITPTLQFLLGVLWFGEQMPPTRWAGFAIVWIALALLAVDAVVQTWRSRTPVRHPQP